MMVHSLFTFFLVLMQVHHVPDRNSPFFTDHVSLELCNIEQTGPAFGV